MTPVEFYEQLLADAGVTRQDSNSHGLFFPGSKQPVTIDGKTLVLPTEEILKSYNDTADSIQVFHPICENIVRKDSTVFNFMKRLYRISLSVDIQVFMTDLLKFASDTSKQAKMTKAQRDCISAISSVDDKVLPALESIFNKNDVNGDNKFIDFNVLRGDKIDGETYSRVAIARFPFLKALMTEKERVFGVKLRKKDIEAITKVHCLILGDELVNKIIENDYKLEFGSNHTHAPNFHSLVSLYIVIKKALLESHKPFSKVFLPLNGQDSSKEWMDKLGDIPVYRALIPTLAGNDGEASAIDAANPDRPRASHRDDVARNTLNERAREDRLRHRREEITRRAEEEERKLLNQPITWEELQARKREMARDERRDRREGRSDRRRSYDRYNIDLSDVDPEMMRAREAEERESRYSRRGYSRHESRPATRNAIRYGRY